MTLHGTRFPTAAIISCLGFVGACTTPYSTPEFRSRPAGQGHFEGISQLLSSTPDKKLDVILVHGMCTHQPDWAHGRIKALHESLSGKGDIRIDPANVDGTAITLFKSSFQVPAGVVNATAMLWSPVTAPLKRQLCYDQTNKSPWCFIDNSPAYEHTRATLNRDLKDELLNDCLADAMIYQGVSRDAISEQVQTAIWSAAGSSGDRAIRADALTAAGNATRALVMITESLGSKVAFDAIDALVNKGDSRRKKAGENTFDRTVQIFMQANQIPILSLAEQALDGSRPRNSLAALMAGRGPRQVVAFTDPNDLLSYALVKQPEQTYPVVDVIVSNDKTYFGYAEHPMNAHRDYRKNARVTRLVACGNPDRNCSR